MSDFKCDPQTRLELDASPNKLQDAAVIQAALGNSGRRIICKNDPNPNATDAWSTGAIFRNVGSNGPLKIQSGRIKDLGILKGTTVQLAADTSVGKSVLRMQSADGSRWIQGSLGPNGDWKATAPFTTTNGLSVTSDFSISGKRFKPSGTGPAAPALDANAPHIFEVWNFTDPANPFMSGSTIIDSRDDDWVYEDAAMALVNGDCAVYQSTTGVLHGNGNDKVEFGFTLLASHQGNTEAGNLPLYEVIGAAAVRHPTWTSYPGSDTYDQSTHNTFPAPFKVIMKNAAGVPLYTFQMQDGLPINGQPYVLGSDTSTPVRPYWNTGMQLTWENTPQVMSPILSTMYAGMVDGAKRPSRAKSHYTVNGVEPMLTGGYQGNSKNGLHTLWAQTQWPRAYKDRPSFSPGDPWLSGNFYQNDGSADSGPWRDGWDYEPGSFSGHNWYTGPGGPRFDRAPIPSILALWGSDPNGSRLAGNVPWKSMARASIKAYHNHSNHWCKNPNTLQLAADNDELFRDWGFTRTYYDSRPSFGPKKISLLGDMRDGDNDSHRDKNGRFVWSGWSRDGLHSYGNAGWGAIFTNSVRSAIASKWDALYQLAGGGGLNRGDYMVRSQAWYWLCFTIAWKLASSHRLGISRAKIEEMFVNHMSGIYRDIYVPAFIDNNQDDFYKGMRNLGVPVAHTDDGQGSFIQGGGLGFYMAGVLALMKQTGIWSVMYAKGGQCKAVMDMQIQGMDKQCCGKILKTGCYIAYENWGTSLGVPNDWTDYGNRHEQKVGQTGMFHNADGSLTNDREVNFHPRAMYPYIRRDYFPEFVNPDIQAACAVLDYEYGAIADYVAAAGDPATQRDRDHIFGYPGVAQIKPPLVLGPA